MPNLRDTLYWCVEDNENKKSYFMAAKWFATEQGSLVIYLTNEDGKEIPMIAFAHGSWKMIYPASVIDGSPCKFEYFRVYG